MIRPRHISRLVTIHRVLVKHGLDEIISATHLFRPLRLLSWITAPGRKREQDRPLGERIRDALIELGPIFVKFGQAVSTRRDLLPPDVADELAKLQDQVPPFPGSDARVVVEKELGKPVGELFATFDENALAAASIAQVHAATLTDGREVVVKVLRPDMERVIRRDVDVLYTLAGLAEKYWKQAWRLRPREVVAEYEKTILNELDLMREAANAAQLRRNFEGTDLLYVPEVYFELCRPTVMVMERISGVPISDMKTLRAHNTNLKMLADNGVTIFFTQVFRHNFFHADMHPGNIFIDIEDPEHPKYMAVDFGIVGSLNTDNQHYLAENFLAFFNRDYYRIAKLHVQSGWVPADTRVDELEAAIRTICEPIFQKPLKDISFGLFLLRLFQVARQFDMRVQPELVLLQKTLLNIEGLGRQLYPELDLWETAQPVLSEWMSERMSGRAVVEKLRADLPEIAMTLRDLPTVANRFVQRMADGEISMSLSAADREALAKQSLASDRRRYAATAGGSGLVAGALLVVFGGGVSWAGWLLAAASTAYLVLKRP